MIVDVKNLSKQFTRGKQRNDSFKKAVESSFRKLLGKKEETGESFWALKDVSFSLEEGEVLGIIGKNGSGKSTLLKILSHIIKPTSGSVTINGRVSSLLEIGAGFHPDLTGRDNIYMNGSLMGMSNSDIKKRFDEIVAFSGLEKYIDTPVKHYSSGMYTRLGFSAAAHLISDVILIDEVLSVGDAEFQYACLQKIRELTRQGKTTIIVSHGMNSILSLCTEAMLLDKGQMIQKAKPVQVISTYMAVANESIETDLRQQQLYRTSFDTDTGWDFPDIVFNKVKVFATNKPEGSRFEMSDEISIEVELLVHQAHPDVEMLLQFMKNYETPVLAVAPNLFSLNPEMVFDKPGIYTFKCTLPPYYFNKGLYSVSLGLKSGAGFHNTYVNAVNFFVNLPAMSEKDNWFRDAVFDGGPVVNWEMHRLGN